MKTRLLITGLLLALLAIGGVQLGHPSAAQASGPCASGFNQAADPVQPGTGQNDYYGPYWNGHTNVYVRMQGYDCDWFVPGNNCIDCWQVQAVTTLINGQFGYTAQSYYTTISGEDQCNNGGWVVDMIASSPSAIAGPTQGVYQTCGGGHDYKVHSYHSFQWSSTDRTVVSCFDGNPQSNNMTKTC